MYPFTLQEQKGSLKAIQQVKKKKIEDNLDVD